MSRSPASAPARASALATRARVALSLGVPALGALSLAALLACATTEPIEIAAADATVLRDTATFHVRVVAPEEAQAAPTEAVPAALREALREQAERGLEARGYALGAAGASDRVLELAPRLRQVRQRSWSSDPDASGTRLVTRTEAVLALRARDSGGGAEVWGCDASAPLPTHARDRAEETERLFTRLLDDSLRHVPPRR